MINWYSIIIALATLVTSLASANPIIGLVIDDLGYQLGSGLRIIAFPEPLSCSIIPYTPYATALAEAAHRTGKEVMLHLPMESHERIANNRGVIFSNMTRAELAQVTRNNLLSLPYVQGVNNHMGSVLTSNRQAMAWLMAALKEHQGMFFLDSRTTNLTVALAAAQAAKIPSTRRDVFLDNIPQAANIRNQFARLIAFARLQGTAVGIAHPRIETIKVLQEILPRLSNFGVTLQPLSAVIARRSLERQYHNPYSKLPELDKITAKLIR